MIVGVDVRVCTDAQPPARDAVVFSRRWTCGSAAGDDNVERRTARLSLPRYVAYRPAADNRYSVFVENASVEAWMLEPAAYADARAYRKFYDAAAQRDRRAVGVVSPWERPRRPDVVDRCPSWSESIRLQLPYRPVCPAELGLFL